MNLLKGKNYQSDDCIFDVHSFATELDEDTLRTKVNGGCCDASAPPSVSQSSVEGKSSGGTVSNGTETGREGGNNGFSHSSGKFSDNGGQQNGNDSQKSSSGSSTYQEQTKKSKQEKLYSKTLQILDIKEITNFLEVHPINSSKENGNKKDFFVSSNDSKKMGGNVFSEIKKQLKNNSAVNQRLQELFVQEMRNLVGVEYILGGKTDRGIDCSGTITVALEKATGLDLTAYRTKEMVAGDCPYVKMNETVDSSKQGDAGMLNFYVWDPDVGVEHVNTGVGMYGDEQGNQVVDATSNSWMVSRNSNSNQIIPAQAKCVNQTFVPYVTTYEPAYQGVINWDYIKGEMWK